MERKRKTWAWIFVALIAVTIGFIWINSCLDKTSSAEESGAVHGTLQKILDFIFSGKVVISQAAVRKLAHFTEFFVLGAEICGLYAIVKAEKVRILGFISLLQYGTYVAVIDEGIQVLSARGAAVSDIFLDFSGYLLSVVLFILAYYVVNKIITAKKIKTAKMPPAE